MNQKIFGVLASRSLVGLVGCAPAVTGTSRTLTFAPQTGVTTTGMGTAMPAQLSSGETATVLRLTGLRPNTNYVAHYHRQGTASTVPCASNGPAIGPSTMTGTTDANGAVEMRNLVASSVIADATYINVHTAGPTFAPTDGGVVCTNLR